jgi:hypothetical protein
MPTVQKTYSSVTMSLNSRHYTMLRGVFILNIQTGHVSTITINVPVVLCTRVLLCSVVVCCCVLLCVRGVGRSPWIFVVWGCIHGVSGEPRTLHTYSFHGSMVECPHPVTGGACSIPGYAVFVEKVGHFLEKSGIFRKKPYFFQVGQVLVVWRKSRAFSRKSRAF